MKVLLHVCCSCCMIYPFEKLRAAGHDVSAYFYNPNIHPSLEFMERLNSVKNYCLNNNVDLTIGKHDMENYFKKVAVDLENRCLHCYELRLGETASAAAETGFEAISTTLLISIYQKFEDIIDIGNRTAEDKGVKFIGEDFRPYFYEAQNKSKELGMYRQKYCGCVFSEKERYAKKLGPTLAGSDPARVGQGMKTSLFDYDLPEELIAQAPLGRRDGSRLLMLNKRTGDIEHRVFSDVVTFLGPGDCLVVNDTKVIPARLIGRKTTGAKAEILLLKELQKNGRDASWEALVKPGRRLKEGDTVLFDREGLAARIGERLQNGGRVVSFSSDSDIREAIKANGKAPLPPYIKAELEDGGRYQTVYFDPGKERSAAAPTAGLHFTDKLLMQAQNKGVKIASVSLDIGLDTFRPVKTEDIEEHDIHSERIELGDETAEIINKTKSSGGRVIAVGTTVVRTLESCADEGGKIKPFAGNTNLFIYPGYRFKVIDGMITNFHLPRSTLLMLVSAFGGHENIMRAYEEAIAKRYRFFSFGDAMLIK